jgi:hypothetical protein
VGYRYVYGGHFETNDYVENSALTDGLVLSPWKGQLRTNEVYLTLDYYL